MTGWIILSILCVMLSPLVWMMPSRKQGARMAVRLEARRLGLGMQLVREAWPHWLGRDVPGTCPQYHRPRRAGQVQRWEYWQTEPGTWVNRWREPCEDERLLNHFRMLPGDVYKIQADAQMVALFWGERGGSEALQPVDQVLRALAA